MTVHITPLPEPTTPPPAPDGGLGALSTGKGNLPLDLVDVHAAITGLAAGIEVVQGFRNPFDVPLEATYIFPLPDRAAVTAMRMEAADRVIEGTLKERAEARQVYDDAIASGRRAAIAEEERPDVFTMRVGNILPGERVTIRLALNQPLPYEDGAATFRFPLVVAPRYVPGAPLADVPAGDGVVPDTDAVPDASRISPPVLLPGFPNPVRLALSATIDPAGLPLTEIGSALHVVAEDADADGLTTVRLQPGERLNRDFILRLAYASREADTTSLTFTPDGPSTLETPDAAGTDAAEGTFTLTVLPSSDVRPPRPRDVVLILDRSGSMTGWKMIAARRAAARIVDTLTSEDRFAVLSFDNSIERPRGLGGGLAEATDRNRFRAIEHLAAITARGGTEMSRPLDEACTLLAGSSHDRVIVLITDGQIGNEDQILARLTPRLRGVRVHTVGIDRAVNAGFLRRLAAGSGGDGEDGSAGRCELVESEDRLDDAMEHIHHRIGSPLVTGLSLHPEGGLELVPDTVAPRRLGALFPGVPLVISGRYRGAPSGTLTVRATAADGHAWERRVSGEATEGSAATAAIWARAHLRDLEDRYAVGGGTELERRIVDASLRFGVLCRFTAFVAVDSRVVAESGGSPHQVVQPVEAPEGWAPELATAPAPRMAPMSAGYGQSMPQSLAPPSPSAPMPAAAPARGSARPLSDSYDEMDVPDFLRPESPAPRPGSAPGGRPARGRKSARRRDQDLSRPEGGPSPSPAAPEQVLAEVRRELADYLARPQEASVRGPQDLLRLHTWLKQIVERLERAGVDTGTVAPLSAFVTELGGRRFEGDLTAVWDEAMRVIADFAEPARPSASPPPPPPAKRAFWKRGN
ncbi:VIT domain-containing protein [Spirillospora sp. NPDC047279]|uniref:VIT domain-containing protein n=1 Tax=Spirillospora sp. NPDC047279 TaxID=3155478 RepID=UPI0033F52BB4